MAREESDGGTRTVIIYRSASSAGLASGIVGSIFAVLGIFSVALLFLPFAVLFSVLSLLRSITGPSASGFAAAMASSFLTVIGFVVSPTAWLAVAALFGMR